MKEEKRYSKSAIISFILSLVFILIIFIFVIGPILFRYSSPFESISLGSGSSPWMIIVGLLGIGLLGLGIPALLIISIFTGIKGIIEIKKNKNLKGMWLAILGLVISGIILIGTIIFKIIGMIILMGS